MSSDLPYGWRGGRLRDVASLARTSVSPGDMGDGPVELLSIPAFDAGMPERVLSDEIGSAKLEIGSDCVLISRLNPRIPRVWRVRGMTERRYCSPEFAPLETEHDADADWLAQVLRSPDSISYLVANATGTSGSHQRVKPDVLLDLPVSIPPIADQRAIASVLGALDDKIESNRRLAKLMQDVLVAEYEHRFGAAQRAAAAGRTIELSGWEAANLGDLIEAAGVATQAEDLVPSLAYVPVDVIDPMTLALTKKRPLDEAKSSLHTFEAGDLLFGAMRPYFHKVAIAPQAGVTRKTVLVLRASDHADRAFAYMTVFAERTIEFATQHSKGSTMPYTDWATMSAMPIALPPQEERAAFSDLAEPLIQSISRAHAEQELLGSIRDSLLPKLVSGRLRVHDIEDFAEESVEE